jgi:hypothetical protein
MRSPADAAGTGDGAAGPGSASAAAPRLRANQAAPTNASPHRAVRRGPARLPGQDLLMAIFLGSSRLVAGMRISSTPSL